MSQPIEQGVTLALDPTQVAGIGYVFGADYAHKMGYSPMPLYLDDLERCPVCGVMYGACTGHEYRKDH